MANKDKKNPDETLNEYEATFIGEQMGVEGAQPEGELIVKILSGLGAGKEYTFAAGQSVVIGRQDNTHICLNHNLVSRHHSKIQWKLNEPWVADLNSTNGTVLNGKKVDEAPLKDGDRLQVGNSVMKIILHLDRKNYDAQMANLMANAQTLVKGRIFSGSLAEMNFAEILQSVALSKREGILVVKGPELGKIYLRDGSVFFAKVGKVTGRKALFRMLSWREGTFDLRHLDDELVAELSEKELKKIGKSFSGDMTQVLLDFFKIQDEFSSLAGKLPKLDDRLRHNPKKKLSKESGFERVYQIYQKVNETPQVQDLLNEFPLLDSEVDRVLVFLLEREFLLKS